MNFEQIRNLKFYMEKQIEVLDQMDKFINDDALYREQHPDENFEDVPNIEVLQSHFMTQRTACHALLGLANRHFPRLKAEHDKEKALAKKPTARPQVVNKAVTHDGNVNSANDENDDLETTASSMSPAPMMGSLF